MLDRTSKLMSSIGSVVESDTEAFMGEPATNTCDRLVTWLTDHQSWFEVQTFDNWQIIFKDICQLTEVPNHQVVQAVITIRIQLRGIEFLYHHSDVPNEKWRSCEKELLANDLKNLIKFSKNSQQLQSSGWLKSADDLLQRMTEFNDYSDTPKFVQAMTEFHDKLLDIGTQMRLSKSEAGWLSCYYTYDMYRESEVNQLVDELKNEIINEMISVTRSEMGKLEQFGWLESVDVEENDGMLFLTAETTPKFRKTTKSKLDEIDFWAENGQIQLASGQSIETPPEFKKLIDMAESFYLLSYDKY